MPLIKCPECSKEVSDKSEACPQCGYPISKLPQKESLMAMIWEGEEPGYISFKCPKCHQSSVIKEASVTKTAAGYKVNGEGHCACGFTFTEIHRDERIKCPQCGSLEFSIQKEGFQAKKACCGAFLVGPLGILCGAKDSNILNRHCLHCGHKWPVGN